jgi:hypothetical protein
MLEGALLVSNYTDKVWLCTIVIIITFVTPFCHTLCHTQVDRTDFKTPAKRAHATVTQLCSMFTGMVLAFSKSEGVQATYHRYVVSPRKLI